MGSNPPFPNTHWSINLIAARETKPSELEHQIGIGWSALDIRQMDHWPPAPQMALSPIKINPEQMPPYPVPSPFSDAKQVNTGAAVRWAQNNLRVIEGDSASRVGMINASARSRRKTRSAEDPIPHIL